LSVSVSIFVLSASDSIVSWSVSVSIFVFVSGITDIDSKLSLRYPYLSLSYAPWSEGGCLSSAKLRSTDSVNPRAVLSRALPRYRLYSKHRDRRCWTGPGIGIRVSFGTYEETQLFRTEKNKRRGSAIGHQPSLHLNVVLSKAALSGPSVCLRARAPCPLRASCFGADSAESYVLLHSVRLQRIVPSSGSGVPVHHPPGSRGRAARAAGLRSGGSLGQDRVFKFNWKLETK